MANKFRKMFETVLARLMMPKESDPPPGSIRWLVERGLCPDCRYNKWNPGPEGGMSMNIRCAECGSKFCYTGPYTQERDRIDNPDSVYSLGETFSFTTAPPARKIR